MAGGKGPERGGGAAVLGQGGVSSRPGQDDARAQKELHANLSFSSMAHELPNDKLHGLYFISQYLCMWFLG